MNLESSLILQNLAFYNLKLFVLRVGKRIKATLVVLIAKRLSIKLMANTYNLLSACCVKRKNFYVFFYFILCIEIYKNRYHYNSHLTDKEPKHNNEAEQSLSSYVASP